MICKCGALQEMRTYKEAEQAGKHVGFELVNSVDIAVASPVAGPWYAVCPTSTNAMYQSVQRAQDRDYHGGFLRARLPPFAMDLSLTAFFCSTVARVMVAQATANFCTRSKGNMTISPPR